MDVNGTRYHLVLGRADWGAWTGVSVPGREGEGTRAEPDVEIDAEREEIALRALVFRFPRHEAPEVIEGAGARRRGAARDRYGNWYSIDDTRRRVLVVSNHDGRSETFWPAVPSPDRGPRVRFRPVEDPAAAPSRFGGVAVTDDHHLVVGGIEPPGLLVFDLHGGGGPLALSWPLRTPFVPHDLAASPEGGVHLLDRANRKLWTFDRQLALAHPISTEVPPLDPFQAVGAPAEERRRLPPLGGAPGLDLPTLAPELDDLDPVAIDSDGGAGVLILDGGPTPRLIHLRRPGEAPRIVPLSIDALVDVSPPPPFAPCDLAYVPETGRLVVVDDQGDQAYAFALRLEPELTVTPLPQFLPLRLFGGKGIVAAGGKVFYDFGDGFVPLEEQPRPRHVRAGTIESPVLDGREPGCTWHRIVLDGCLSPQTALRVWTRAHDEASEVSQKPWVLEPPLYRRSDGSELPHVPRDERRHGGSYEVLLQRARGRHLQVRLDLTGDGRTSPRVRALRVYYPRFSYLARYLPAVYREDPESASFLERFLANPEGFFTTIEGRVAEAQLLFDPDIAPADALPWLASWFDVALDPVWTEERRRLFLRRAMDFFRWRGTSHGVALAVRLALDPALDDRDFDAAACTCDDPAQAAAGIRIVERWRTTLVDPVDLGDPGDALTLSALAPQPRWTPPEGASELVRRWSELLIEHGLAEVTDFPIADPADETTALWRAFGRAVLGFVPAGRAQVDLWRDFLRRRYHRIDVLEAVYGAGATFEAAAPPAALPADRARLTDWFDFERVVVGFSRAAHRFTVMLPVDRGARFDPDEPRRRELARRIVELEKPAHTVFDVKFYWALLRIGAARLGVDTVLGRGARDAELLAPMVLGAGMVGESYPAPRPPGDSRQRRILDRDLVNPTERPL